MLLPAPVPSAFPPRSFTTTLPPRLRDLEGVGAAEAAAGAGDHGHAAVETDVGHVPLLLSARRTPGSGALGGSAVHAGRKGTASGRDSTTVDSGVRCLPEDPAGRLPLRRRREPVADRQVLHARDEARGEPLGRRRRARRARGAPTSSANSARCELRARCAPRQKCSPMPKPRCGFGWRSMRKRVGLLEHVLVAVRRGVEEHQRGRPRGSSRRRARSRARPCAS